MDKLFTPGKIGKLTIKNRAVLAPMQMMYGEHQGYAGEKAIAYYEERARGGVGLILFSYTHLTLPTICSV